MDTVTVQFGEGHKLYPLQMVIQRRLPVGIALGLRSGDIARCIDPFINQVVSWNVEGVPFSREAFDSRFDMEEAISLIVAWAEEVKSVVAAPLDVSSPSEESLVAG